MKEVRISSEIISARSVLFRSTVLLWFLLALFETAKTQIKSDLLVFHGISPCVKFDDQNRIHLTWSDTSAFYALWDSTFAPIKAPVKVSIPLYANTPRLAVSPSGTIVVWSKWTYPINHWLIYSSRITPIGDTLGGNTELDNASFNPQLTHPDIAFLDDTTFVGAWVGNIGGGTDWGAWAKISTLTFQMPQGDILCSDTLKGTGSDQIRVVSNRTTGDFFVLWKMNPTGKRLIYGRLYNRGGVPITPVTLLSDNPKMMDVWFMSATTIVNQGFLVVWGSEEDSVWKIKQRRVGFNGVTIGPEELVSDDTLMIPAEPTVDVAADELGRHIVVWEQLKGLHSKIFAQRYSSDGTRIGQNFQVSGAPDSTDHYFPSVDIHNGLAATTWMTYVSPQINFQIWANLLSFDKPTSVEVSKGPVVHDLRLEQNHPNPFNPSTLIAYQVDGSGPINLSVYNILGQEVRVLLNSVQNAGIHQAVWDGKSDSEIPLPTGIYFCRLKSLSSVKVIKMLLIR